MKVYIKTSKGWKKSNFYFPNLIRSVNIYKHENKFEILIDKINPEFLKGYISKDGKISGARINILPNGEKLEKAFSLFSEDLKINDDLTHDHWNVMYKNKCGNYSYVYTLKKRMLHKKNKYRKVEDFEKIFFKLKKNVKSAILSENDILLIAMHILLETKIGLEIYLILNFTGMQDYLH